MSMTESKPPAEDVNASSAIAPNSSSDEAWTNACKQIGSVLNGKKVIGVDPKPPKHQEGLYFVLASPGQLIEYQQVEA